MKHDELNQKRQKLHQDERKLAHHVKLYKSGTLWIAAGMTTAVFGIFTATGLPVASAATTDTTAAVKSAENSVSASSYRLKTSETTQMTTSTQSTAAVINDLSKDMETGDSSAELAPAVTTLGDADRTQIDQAKQAASKQYAQTGQPQVVTAVSASAPQTTATGEVTIKYVDEDDPTAVLSFDRDKAGFPAAAPATISGSYTATTAVSPDLVTKMKVKDAYVEPTILGYTFDKLGDGDTLNFAPVADGKTITVYYKNDSAQTTTTGPTTTQTETTPEKTATGQVTIKYVDEDDPTAVLSFDRDKAGFPAAAPATISGSYTATTAVSPDLVTKMKVKDAYVEPTILGYTFDKLGDGDTLNFASVAEGKTITAYYKNDSAQATTTGPTTTQTETTPKATVTGQVTIAYVDKDTQQLLEFNSGQSSIPGDSVQINGTYVAQTTVSEANLSQVTVSSKVAQAEIAGYKFVGNDTTDLTFALVDQQKTIKAYYEKLAPVLINYVNEDDSADVIFQINYDTQDPVALISGSADYNFDYEPTFNGYTYDEQKTQAESVLKGNGFKSLDETDGLPFTINVYYKKTTTDPNPGAMYIGDSIVKASDVTNTSTKINDFDASEATFVRDSLPEVSVANPVSGAVVTINGHVVNQYPNYTLTGTIGTNNQAGNLSQGLMPIADYISNQPVEVVFVDASTGKILQQGFYGEFDPAKGILPSGNYDTGVVNEAYQPNLAEKGYEFAKVYGEPTGTYDAMHRIVYYAYTPKRDINYVPVTRVITFTSSDGGANMNPVTQTVWYKKLTNEVTGESVYTPQNGFVQYEIPTLSGYSAIINDQPATVVAQEGLPATTGMPTNESVTVNYVKLPSVIIPPTEDVETPPDDGSDGAINVTTNNQVPTVTEKDGKTVVETDKTKGVPVSKRSGSPVQPGVTTDVTVNQTDNLTTNPNVSSTTRAQLPQTDEKYDGVFGFLGAVLMSMIGLSGIKKKRRD
ncbi:KxYKxGKxW signal peptide domain-containing protein [Secundilactobacillus mixtipabuli]|uniref:Gram-positive cocci surface proteins LPxTG domain-containing protein n=1 Tax=Secundilactobacillus mixtipabuli TaxID=1435342 RepID=A0A1Z5IC68_9LACO|nr:KxYKxGKxW signal peptide domain-containing protein [Secundilactobacillus mixtipabuli]GAW99324.1 hypothetical protein IWT30_01293 [Secundilactobacillus mixtipabuli]